MRPIDADALRKLLTEYAAHRIGHSDGSKYDVGRTNGVITARDFVGEAPTIDAVPVVRCEDCRYWAYDCDVGHICGNTEKFTRQDDYCSYGEKTNGATER